MNISIINGSPKSGESTSGLLIKYLLQETGESNAQVFKCSLQATELAEIASSDVLVFVFPLYVDSIPSQLLQFLIILGERKDLNHDIMVYCVVNNGFFEGTQNYIAIQQMKNWCVAANLKWARCWHWGWRNAPVYFQCSTKAWAEQKNRICNQRFSNQFAKSATWKRHFYFTKLASLFMENTINKVLLDAASQIKQS